MNPKVDNSYYPQQPTMPPVLSSVDNLTISRQKDLLSKSTILPSPDNFTLSSQSTESSAFHVESQPLAQWSTGLCDCGDDISNCCITCWCPCVTFGRIAEIVDKGSTSCGASGALYTLILCLTGCQCIYSCLYRSKLRGQYSLQGGPCNDCLLHWCCESCALCQEYRELKRRGFDMNIGWQSNMERQGKAAPTTAPPIFEGGMRR